MITVVFKNCTQINTVGTLWQYDYGQVLRIQGLNLPSAVEINFSLDAEGGDSVTRVGLTTDGVTDVTIPDSMLENNDAESSYKIYAFVYLTNEEDESGETRVMATLPVRARAKREATTSSEEALAWAEVVAALENYASTSSEAATLAKSWAVGGTETRDGEDEDNAKFYSKLALDALASIAGRIVAAKEEIDSYVDEKEATLKGDTGDVYFTCFKVVDGRLLMYTNSEQIVEFYREGSRFYSHVVI